MITGTETQTVTPDKLMQLGVGFWASRAFLSAVELGVFTCLAKSPASAASLEKELGINQRASRDFLDTLVSLGLLLRDNKGNYSNTPETATFLDANKKDSYIGGFFTMVSSRNYAHWGNLTDALKTGCQQNESKGEQEPFEKMYETPAKIKVFLQAMTAISRGVSKEIARHIPKDANTFFDIGTAEGGLAVDIALEQKHLKGGGFDLPMVKSLFEEFVRSYNLQDRLEFRAGNFFKDPLPQADVLTMGHILHDWDLEQKKLLISKAYDALPEGGRLFVYDTMIDDERRQNTLGLLMSLNMLVETPGGFDYTHSECKKWLLEAGFTDVSFEQLPGPHTLAIARK